MEEIIPIEKVCTKCSISKLLVNFFKDSNGKFGRRSVCKNCDNIRAATYRSENQEKTNTQKKKYYQKNREKIKLKRAKYYIENTNTILQRSAKYKKERLKTDSIFRLTNNLRSRILQAITGVCKKSTSTQKLLGCSFNHAKTHLESQFKPGMTWENHGVKGWHIDHIRPCASFDLSKPEEQAKCFHYTNLQPLWATTEIARQNGDMESIGNINKGDSLEIRV